MFYVLNHENMSIQFSVNIGDEIWGAPAIFDYNNDGFYEIAITSKNNSFYILSHSGVVLYQYNTENFLMAAPAIDTDNVIWVPSFASDGKIFKFYHTGTEWVNESILVNKKIQKGLAIHDINQDGNTDYVYGTDDDTVEMQISGEDLSVYNVGGKIRSAPIIIEFRDDEFLIVAGSNDNNLYGINPLTEQFQFIYETDGNVESPSVFEHRQFGTVIVFGSSDGQLYMIDTNGNDVDGWPLDLGGPIKGSPAISDINNDGLTDIAIGQSEGKVFVINENGVIQNNFPITIEFPFTSSPIIKDIDNDNDLELLLGASTGLYGYDFKNTGNSNGYWSMYRGNMLRNGYFESITYLDVNINDYPETFNISSIYPNPFNPKVSIQLDVPNNKNFTLSIYNLNGSLVQELYSGKKSVGKHMYSWDASMYSSGIYFVNLSTNDMHKTHKIMLVK